MIERIRAWWTRSYERAYAEMQAGQRVLDHLDVALRAHRQAAESESDPKIARTYRAFASECEGCIARMRRQVYG